VRLEGEGTAAVADDRTRVILFRAVRELLINTAMHAGARVAIVRLSSKESMLHITVEDEGVGFDIEEVGLAGYGLFGIREQLRYVGGGMHVDSAIGRGTKVTLTAPLATGRAASI
jgi:signal transduction histidine kinase